MCCTSITLRKPSGNECNFPSRKGAPPDAAVIHSAFIPGCFDPTHHSRRRAEAKKSEEENKRAQERRRKWNAEYREYGLQSTPPVRRSLARKFLQNLMSSRRYKKKYGAEKYLKCYFPLVMKYDGDLTEVQVPTGEDDEEFLDEKAQGRGIAVD
ncbi:hypothetical protein B0H13DRAFT_1862121 [Mycena leptocephala]|nr:hypothetical protein B0H13DRAFT_1862121 [Mycena leptocephala]